MEQLTLFERGRPHPAKYSAGVIVDAFARLIPAPALVLDPFGGVGGIHHLRKLGEYRTVAVEIEREWAMASPGHTVQGDSTCLPFADDTFDAVATSPAYGNRMADSNPPSPKNANFVARKYQFLLGRKMHPNNGSSMHFGVPYRKLHTEVWREVRRVLRPGGVLLLNMKDHIRRGVPQPVVAWHCTTLSGLGGFHMDTIWGLSTPGIPIDKWQRNAKKERCGDGELVVRFFLNK